MPSRLLSLCLICVTLALAPAGCSRPPDLVGVDNPAIPVASVADLTRHRIYIMTTREASEVTETFFSAGRAPDLGLASVDVTIPPTHVIGTLNRPTRLPPDPRVEFTVVDPTVYPGDAAFIAELDRALASRAPGDRNVLLFVHGFNNSTSDAILRLTQFVEDSGYQGVPVLMTWASAARASRYVFDLNSVLVARVQLKNISDILARTRADHVDIFAHSMGAFLTMEGLMDAELSGRLGTGPHVNSIVLASPDIDMDLFRVQIGILPSPVLEKIYVLISRDDQALRVSRALAGGVPRVGAADAGELEALGLTVIDLSEIADSSSGSHSKFAGSPEAVQLIGKGLNSVGRFDTGTTPGLEQLLENAPIRILRN